MDIDRTRLNERVVDFVIDPIVSLYERKDFMAKVIALALLIPSVCFAEGLPFLDTLIDLVPEGGTALVVVSAVLEILLRLFKSQKPLSILLVIAGVLKQLMMLFEKLAALIDKVIPQRTM